MLTRVTATDPSSLSVMEMFEATGAYLRGHFRLTSGLHSGEYLQCAKVLAHPELAEELGKRLRSEIQPLITGAKRGAEPDLVVCPAIGGIVIGHEVARALGTRCFFTERDAATNTMTLRRGFEVRTGETAVVIEDVVTTGGSTREVVDLLQAAGVTVLAAGSIMDRSNGRADVGAPRVALQTLNPEAWVQEECPLCRQGEPVVKPGSRRV